MIKSFFSVVFFLFASSSHTQNFTFSETIDLNSDGAKESISLTINKAEPNQFTLQINDKFISDSLGGSGIEIDGFQVIDIDTSDHYKEIAVHTPGSSSDDEYLIFWFDGKNIVKMNHLSRWPIFTGDAVVYVDNWEGFWKRRDIYVLDKQLRTLKLVPQYSYYVGVKLRVKKTFPIYQNADLKEIITNLIEGSEITLLLCRISDNDWLENLYLIKTEDDLIGWAKFQSIYENSGGFQFAD